MPVGEPEQAAGPAVEKRGGAWKPRTTAPHSNPASWRLPRAARMPTDGDTCVRHAQWPKVEAALVPIWMGGRGHAVQPTGQCRYSTERLQRGGGGGSDG